MLNYISEQASMHSMKLVLVCMVTIWLIISASCREQQTGLLVEGTCLNVFWGVELMQWRQQQKQCSEAEPHPSIDSNLCPQNIYPTNPKQLAHILMVLQNREGLRCAGQEDPIGEFITSTWTMYDLLFGSEDSSPLDPPPAWAEHCSLSERPADIGKIPPPQPELYEDIWPKIVHIKGDKESDEKSKDNIENAWYYEGCCALKYAQYQEKPPQVQGEPNPISHCTDDQNKFNAAYCFYRQAEMLFKKGVPLKKQIPVLNTTKPYLNASVVLNEVLLSLFGTGCSPDCQIKGPLIQQDVQKAFHDVTNIYANPYLECQKKETSNTCFLTRVGLCFKCAVSLNNDEYGSCTPPTDLDPNDPDYVAYSPGKLVPCTNHAQIPWSSKEISCYSSKCKKIYYTPSLDSACS